MRSFPCHVRNNRADSRSGFTLLELIIVLSVIAILAGLAWPRLVVILKEQRLKDDAEMVRQQLDRARVQAVQNGMAFQFRFEPNGRRFVLLPYELLGTPASDTAGLTASREPNRFAPGGAEADRFPVYELSEECRFHRPSALSGESVAMERLPDAYLDFLQNGHAHQDVSWSAPVVYYPNGTSTDAVITVVDQNRRAQDLIVRGLTGTVSVTPVGNLRDLFGG